MRTKTIGRWRRAALSGLMSATLGAPMAARAQQTPPAPPDDQAKPAEGRPTPAENAARPAAPEPTGPIAVPPGTPDQYTIQKGDTLWDLSQKFLNNPWYWPKIWSLNPGIENPHWIYPGNRLKIVPGEGGPQAPAQVQANAAGGEGEPKGPGEQAADTADLPAAPSGSGSDIEVMNRNGRLSAAASNAVSVSGKLTFTPPPVIAVRTSGLVSPEEVKQAGTLDASFEEKELLANFDTAYIRFKGENAPVKAGDKMILFRPDGAVIHPITHQKLADKTKSVGVVKVLSVRGDLATVQIESTYEEVSRGDLARPWTPTEKRVVPRPNTKDVSAVIVSALNPGLSTYGESNEVFIDKGTADGVEEGNTFAVVRKGDGLSNALVTKSYTAGEEGTRSARKTSGVPDENVGLLLVVDVKEHLSTAIVVKSIRELQAGDTLEMHTSGAGGP